jgi:hypothetical protein
VLSASLLAVVMFKGLDNGLGTEVLAPKPKGMGAATSFGAGPRRSALHETQVFSDSPFIELHTLQVHSELFWPHSVTGLLGVGPCGAPFDASEGAVDVCTAGEGLAPNVKAGVVDGLAASTPAAGAGVSGLAPNEHGTDVDNPLAVSAVAAGVVVKAGGLAPKLKGLVLGASTA